MFRDSQNQSWDLLIDLPACRRVRDLTGVNLLSLHLPGLLTALADPLTLVDVLYAICKPDVDRARLDQDGFLRRLAIDLNPVVDLLLSRLADFFRRLGKAQQATQLELTIRRATELANQTDPATMATAINATFDWMTAEILRRTSGTAATERPASSESIPTSPA